MKFTLIALAASTTAVSAQQFTLKLNYSGSTFFDRWTFQNGIDANNTGNVLFQTFEQAQQANLIGVTGDGNAFMKVDNTTTPNPGDTTFGRPSVKILSNDTLSEGDLLIMDAVHMPFGCSVWPGFWTQGSNWPIDGEIDIVENVNLATANRMSLHTGPNCTLTNSTLFGETGTVVSTDCFNQTSGNLGCVVQDNRATSFGAGFAQNGGGVYAMLRDSSGVRQWFFPRGSVPADASSSSPNPSGWPTPTAFFPANSCSTNFGQQTIMVDITICGNFAGNSAVYQETCQGNNVTCLQQVADPTNYNDAYFEWRSITVFSQGGSSNSSSNSSSSGGGSSSGGSGSSGSGSSGNGTAAGGHSAALSVLEHGKLAFTVVGILGAAAISMIWL